jgi:hypothetical protein
MTQDISETIRAAAKRKASWGKPAVRRVLDAVAAILPESPIDWDTGAGERWASILDKNPETKVAAFVSVDIPLAFVDEDFAKELGPVLREQGIEVLVLRDIYELTYSADPTALSEAFRSVASGVDWTNFCAQDLWWATI